MDKHQTQILSRFLECLHISPFWDDLYAKCEIVEIWRYCGPSAGSFERDEETQITVLIDIQIHISGKTTKNERKNIYYKKEGVERA